MSMADELVNDLKRTIAYLDTHYVFSENQVQSPFWQAEHTSGSTTCASMYVHTCMLCPMSSCLLLLSRVQMPMDACIQISTGDCMIANGLACWCRSRRLPCACT